MACPLQRASTAYVMYGRWTLFKIHVYRPWNTPMHMSNSGLQWRIYTAYKLWFNLDIDHGLLQRGTPAYMADTLYFVEKLSQLFRPWNIPNVHWAGYAYTQRRGPAWVNYYPHFYRKPGICLQRRQTGIYTGAYTSRFESACKHMRVKRAYLGNVWPSAAGPSISSWSSWSLLHIS